MPFFKAMAQSRRGVVQVMEVQMRPLVVAIPRFIQIRMPLPPPSALTAAKALIVE
jgi:hypothetical protein